MASGAKCLTRCSRPTPYTVCHGTRSRPATDFRRSSMLSRCRVWKTILLSLVLGTIVDHLTAPAAAGDISSLDQHFNLPGQARSHPGSSCRQSNVKEFSTEEHPGLATIYEAGRGQDIKGILKDPIRIGDYRLPWEFQTSMVQSFNLTAGVGAKTQVNSAIGLNVAVTFSDPSEWPTDRTAATAARRGSSSSWSCTSAARARPASACRSSRPNPTPRRTSSGAAATWAIRSWATGGSPTSGSATGRSTPVRPARNCSSAASCSARPGWPSASSSTPLTAGTCAQIDCSEFGRITGVWEIGPIISADRWIPDVLCRNLPQVKGPHPLMLGQGDPEHYRQTMTPVAAPKPEPPNPKYEYYVDYCVFFGAEPRPLRGVLRRVRHHGLPRPLAGPGAMHADGHPLAPGLPDAQAARARGWAPDSGRRAGRA